MKRIVVSLLLVTALVLSSICTVGASTMTKDEFIAACVELQRPVSAPTKIEGKLESQTTYRMLVEGNLGAKSVFRATLDMNTVKEVVRVVRTRAAECLDAEDLAKFNALPITGSFEFTATWTGVNPPADIREGSLVGFAFDGQNESAIFEEGSVRTVTGNTLVATINVKDGVIVSDTANPDNRGTLEYLPEKITLTVDDFVINSDAYDGGQMQATMKGSTNIGGLVDVTYMFSNELDGDRYIIEPVDILAKRITPGGGGGGSTPSSKYYDLTYIDGETVLDKENYKEGKIVELTKIPEKEGYVFDGWFEEPGLINKVASVTMNSDISVYAKWTKIDDSPIGVVHPVPGVLNGDDHILYIAGYPDGTVKPQNKITRAEVATIFFRLLKNEVREEYLSDENPFDDVNEGNWFNAPVSTMAKLGIVKGRSEKEFAPNDYITRAEFATICARFDDADEKGNNIFKDIDGHWAKDYILEAVAYKWIEGYTDSTFRPDNFITRAESATLINRVLHRLPENNEALLEGMKVWPDNNVGDWYYIAIQEATNSHTYGRVNALNEKWTALVENIDWTEYEK